MRQTRRPILTLCSGRCPSTGILPLILGFLGCIGFGTVLRAQTSPAVATAKETYENPLTHQGLSDYDIRSYDLRLHVTNKNTWIEGEAEIRMDALVSLDTVVLELQDALHVDGAFWSAKEDEGPEEAVRGVRHRENALILPLGRQVQAGEGIRLRIVYAGEAGQGRGFFSGVSRREDSRYGFDVTYSLSQPNNARDWFPAKQVLSDKIDSVSMRIRCDKNLMAASNGRLVGIDSLNRSDREFHWKTHYSMAYYLMFFAVADYRDLSFRAPLGNGRDSVLVQNFIYDLDEVEEEQGKDIRATADLIRLFSETLGPYPFEEEKYGHAMAPLGGGMEHQTMTTIENFDFFLVAHELAHQWFGDLVTCSNWQDIWINEGFASYMEYVAAMELQGSESAERWMNQAMSAAGARRRGSLYVPASAVENTWRLFDHGLSYKKGAVLLHMIRHWLEDDELFFRILRLHLEEHRGAVADGEDFRRILERESGMDFSDFFTQWYYGEGYPRFDVRWTQEESMLVLEVAQEGTAPDRTPVFSTCADMELRFTDGTTERKRIWVNRSVHQLRFPVNGPVVNLVFDPDGWLLHEATVNEISSGTGEPMPEALE
ncbi:MAG: M1 family metallopeptidase [Bacteroidales bacterium]